MMEAKDTVIKPDELALAIIKHPELPMGQAISIEQAEISFKAGIREVVDNATIHSHRKFVALWIPQAKLKEWGI